MQKPINDYKGFSLFNEIESVDLRNRNRAVVLANITEDNLTKNKRLTEKGTVLVLGYFACIPDEDKGKVQNLYAATLNERGFKV